MVKKEAEQNKKFITVKQVSSPIGRGEAQLKTLIGLGLNKIGRSRKLEATPSVMGMVSKVKHLLEIEHLS